MKVFQISNYRIFNFLPSNGPRSLTALLSALCLCVRGSEVSGLLGLGPQGPSPVIYSPYLYEFIGSGVTQGLETYEFIRFAWDRLVRHQQVSEIKAVNIGPPSAT